VIAEIRLLDTKLKSELRGSANTGDGAALSGDAAKRRCARAPVLKVEDVDRLADGPHVSALKGLH